MKILLLSPELTCRLVADMIQHEFPSYSIQFCHYAMYSSTFAHSSTNHLFRLSMLFPTHQLSTILTSMFCIVWFLKIDFLYLGLYLHIHYSTSLKLFSIITCIDALITNVFIILTSHHLFNESAFPLLFNII